MKKLITLVSFCVFATTTVALKESDWSVITKMDDGSPVVYTVLPNTVQTVTVEGGPEQRVTVEIRTAASPDPISRMLRVLGCENEQGLAVLADAEGNLPDGVGVFTWSKDGSRVADMLAVRGCAAAIIKRRPSPDSKWLVWV